MRLIFIRHAEPDYRYDGLTERGKKEAILLAKRTKDWKVEKFYMSPLGRAIDTAKPTLEAVNRDAVILPWIREFSYTVRKSTREEPSVCWDFIPSDWANDPKMSTMTEWLDIEPACQNKDLKTNYFKVIQGIDEIIEEYGLVRNGNYYISKNPKNRRIKSTEVDSYRHIANELPDEDAEPTLVFFCHFGVISLILSHLLNIPFYSLVHGTVIPPTGITVLTSEERWDDQAYFRLQTLGDVGHILSAGEKISGAGSFAPLFQG